MEFGLFKKIMDDASAIGVHRIHLYLHGEPLLHPDFVEMVRYIKSRGLFFNLVTNGMLFDEAMIQGILNAGADLGDHIVFSVLGHSKGVHETIMAGIHQEKVFDNISAWIQMRRKANRHAPIVEVVFYAMPENQKEETPFVKYWSGKVDHVRTVSKISQLFRDYKRPAVTAPVFKNRCPNIWERMAVFWNGDVTICCEDVDGDYILGNLTESSIREIWNCRELSALKHIHRKKEYHKHPLCSFCDM